MMSATGAAVLISLATLLGVIAGRLWNGGRREGKIDAALERLIDLVEDHEDRIRFMEGRRARSSAGSHRRR